MSSSTSIDFPFLTAGHPPVKLHQQDIHQQDIHQQDIHQQEVLQQDILQ